MVTGVLGWQGKQELGRKEIQRDQKQQEFLNTHLQKTGRSR